MKKLLFVLLVSGSFAAMAQKKTDFSGSFKVNLTKTQLGPAPEWILPRYVKADQPGDKVIISRVRLNQQLEEQPAYYDTLAFNGAPSVRTTAKGKTTTTLKWLSDTSFQLLIESVKPDGGLVVKTTEDWTLEDDGKTLLITSAVEQGNGMKYGGKNYFDRQ